MLLFSFFFLIKLNDLVQVYRVVVVVRFFVCLFFALTLRHITFFYIISVCTGQPIENIRNAAWYITTPLHDPHQLECFMHEL